MLFLLYITLALLFFSLKPESVSRILVGWVLFVLDIIPWLITVSIAWYYLDKKLHGEKREQELSATQEHDYELQMLREASKTPKHQ